MRHPLLLVLFACLGGTLPRIDAQVTSGDYASVAELILDDELADASEFLDTLLTANPEHSELRKLRDIMPPVPPRIEVVLPPFPPLPPEDQQKLEALQARVAEAKTVGDYSALQRSLDALTRRHKDHLALTMLELQIYAGGGPRNYLSIPIRKLQRLGLWDNPPPEIRTIQQQLEKRQWIPSAQARKAASNRTRELTDKHLHAAAQATALARAERRRTATPTPERDRAFNVPNLDLLLMPIASGSFSIGKIIHVEQLPRTVTIANPFWIGETEVTRAQWEAVMGSRPRGSEPKNMPVAEITWNEAVVFCQTLTRREHAAGRLPEDHLFSLPTEAQWEYARRAGSTIEFAAKINARAWIKENSGRRIHVPATKLANAWGLYDMEGNVREWHADTYAKSDGPITPPVPILAPSNSQAVNIARGGSWNDEAAATHSVGTEGARSPEVGFRVVLNRVPASPQKPGLKSPVD